MGRVFALIEGGQGLTKECGTQRETSAAQVYGWSTCVDTVVKEMVQVLRETTRLPVRENSGSWNPLDSSDAKTLFILLVPQTASPSSWILPEGHDR